MGNPGVSGVTRGAAILLELLDGESSLLPRAAMVVDSFPGASRIR
jgi:hypothetical protein